MAQIRCTGRRTEGDTALCYWGLSLDIGHAGADTDIWGPSLACGVIAKGGLRRRGQHIWVVCEDEGAGGVVGCLDRGDLGARRLGSLVLSTRPSLIYTLYKDFRASAAPQDEPAQIRRAAFVRAPWWRPRRL